MPPRTDRPHERAFGVYAALGEKRTYRQVAKQLGVSLSSVKGWAHRENWQTRLREREAQAARQLADSVRSGPDPDSVRNLKIVRVALMRVAKGIAEGKVRMQMGDLEPLGPVGRASGPRSANRTGCRGQAEIGRHGHHSPVQWPWTGLSAPGGGRWPQHRRHRRMIPYGGD